MNKFATLLLLGMLGGAVMTFAGGGSDSSSVNTTSYESYEAEGYAESYDDSEVYDAEAYETEAYTSEDYTSEGYASEDYTSESYESEAATTENYVSDTYAERQNPVQVTQSTQEILNSAGTTEEKAAQLAYSLDGQDWSKADRLFEIEDLLGFWVDDLNTDYPHVIKFWMEGDALCYRYYRICPGNEIGINLANESTAWDYAVGYVETFINHGTVSLLRKNNSINESFYYGFDGADIMVNQEDGEMFYRYTGEPLLE